MKELFQNAAFCLFDIIAEKKAEVPQPQALLIEQKADDLQELFVNWLNELVSLSSSKELIFFDFDVQEINDRSLRAIVSGCKAEYFKQNVEVKAATYHQLKVERDEKGWLAEVIFDV